VRRGGESGGPVEVDAAANVEPDRAGTVGAAVRETIAALVFGLSSIGQAISMAVLIFSGPLQSGLPRAIASFTVAGAVLAILAGVRSRIVPAGTSVQDGPAIVLVAVAATIGTGSASSVVDVFVALVITSISTGLLMWLLGRFRLGLLARYVPITVIGAFMAGTGWLLVKGGLDVMVGFRVEPGDIDDLFTAELAKFWIPGAVIGVGVWLIGRSKLPVAAMSAAIVASVVGFFVIVALTSSLDAVEDGGWLIGPFADGTGPSIVSPSEFADADWARILSRIPGIASVVAVAVLVLLLNVTGLGLRWSERIDVDAELRTFGIANVLIGPLGSAPGFLSVSDTVLLKQIGARRRVVPIAAGVLMLVFGIFGVGLIGYLPRLIVGALLIVVGLELLVDWVEGLVQSISKIEQLMSIGIVLVIAAVGILEGIGVGLVAACAVFIVRYSRVDPIRLSGSGHAMRSRVDRVPVEVDVLRARSDRLAVFELQGYLFFGSVTSLEDRISADVDTVGSTGELDAVVLDFRTVTGIDTSAYSLIGQLAESLTGDGALVVMSAVDGDLQASLLAAEPQAFEGAEWAVTLDDALERTERLQLDAAGLVLDNDHREPIALSEALLAEFDEVGYEAGVIVIRQGDPTDGMFVLMDGIMTAFRIDGAGQRHRLRRFGRSALVGEIGLTLGGLRSAEIVAETDVTVMWLSAERYGELRRESPHLAFELHEFIMRGQAARVVSLSEGLTHLSR
jgi:SulP family sulfate permease